MTLQDHLPTARSAIAVTALLGAITAAVVVFRQRKAAQHDRREFARRYAQQLQAARHADDRKPNDGSLPGAPAPRGGNSFSLAGGSDALEGDANEDTAQVKVIYGSESGNAEALAKGLVMTLRDLGVSAVLIDPSRWRYFDTYLHHNRQHIPLFGRITAPGARTEPEKPTSSTPVTRTVSSVGASFDSVAAAAALPEEIYLFVVSTAGEGDPPPNYLPLFQEMQLAAQAYTTTVAAAKGDARFAAGPPPFAHVSYAVFGLGDSSYKYYCRAGTATSTCLRKGGGKELFGLRLGDARGEAVEDAFDEWQEGVFAALQTQCHLTLTTSSLTPPKPQLEFRTLPAEAADALPFAPPLAIFEPSVHHPKQLTLSEKVQLTPVRPGDHSAVYRCAFAIEGTNVNYQAGDHLGVFPTNPPDVVQRYATLLGLTEEQLNAPVELCTPGEGRTRRNVLPARVPLQTVLERYVDLCGRPKRSALRVLAKYCTKEEEKLAFVQEVHPHIEAETPKDGAGTASKENAEGGGGEGSGAGDEAPRPPPPPAHTQLVGSATGAAGGHTTMLDYMERYPSCCAIPIGHFLEIMPPIQPRYYSIASDRLSHPYTVEILIRAIPDGLTSRYVVDRVQQGDSVFAFVRLSSFHLPNKLADRPIVMIGPGTGAAAMVGLCYRREALMRRQPTARYGPCVFFFGAQHADGDYFVKEEVERWALTPDELAAWDVAHPNAHAGMAARHSRSRCPLPQPVVTLLDCAFSRDTPTKVYVTHLIEKHSELIYQLITQPNCLLYLSGDASVMAGDVERTLVALLQAKGGLTRTAAQDALRRMESEHRYLRDVY